MARAEAACRTYSPSRGRAARTHIQPRTRYCSAHSGGKREGPGAICARVQLHCGDLEGAMSKDAVLLIAHGSPERVEDIPEFLQNISRGRPMAEAVVREVQHRYSLIGSSPLTRITRQQADGVSRDLGTPAYVAMRNWHPFIADTLQQMTDDGVERAVAICLAPHNSRTSVGLYKQVLFGNDPPFTIDFVEEWHDHPLLIEAFAEKLRAGWSMASADHGTSLPVLFTAHSVSQRTIAEGDLYEMQAMETAMLVAAHVPEIGL